MTRRYFSQKEINKVKNGMKVTYYEEYYKPSARHGIQTAIIIVVSKAPIIPVNNNVNKGLSLVLNLRVAIK